MNRSHSVQEPVFFCPVINCHDSAANQTLTLQLDQLRAVGCEQMSTASTGVYR